MSIDNEGAEERTKATMTQMGRNYERALESLPEGKYRNYLSTHRSEFYVWFINRSDERPLGDFFAEQGVWKQGDEIPDYLLE